MLFDLQSPGRKRVVQVVFGLLAVIFAISFVFLGIGTGLSGSPLEAIGIGGADDPTEILQNDIDDNQSKVEENPGDTAALIELINLRFQAANQKYAQDQETGQVAFTTEAEEELERAGDNWDAYLKAVGKKKPDSSAALIAVQVFSALAQGQLQRAAGGGGQAALDTAEESLTNWKNAGEAQMLVADTGSPVQRAQAAEFLFYGGDFAAAQAAAQQAIAAAPAKQTKALQNRLDAAEKEGRGLNTQIDAYRKRLAQASSGGPGGAGDPGGEALGGLGGGGALGGGGGLGGGGLATP